MIRRFLSRTMNAIRGRRADRDLTREVEAHLTLIRDDFVRRGLDTADAIRAARLTLGGVEQTKERQRDARSFLWAEDAKRDLGFAARLLFRQPIFTATAVVSLAIGIGANTTLFTIAHALLFRAPAGVTEPASL